MALSVGPDPQVMCLFWSETMRSWTVFSVRSQGLHLASAGGLGFGGGGKTQNGSVSKWGPFVGWLRETKKPAGRVPRDALDVVNLKKSTLSRTVQCVSPQKAHLHRFAERNRVEVSRNNHFPRQQPLSELVLPRRRADGAAQGGAEGSMEVSMNLTMRSIQGMYRHPVC